jgi:hypothetical protein
MVEGGGAAYGRGQIKLLFGVEDAVACGLAREVGRCLAFTLAKELFCDVHALEERHEVVVDNEAAPCVPRLCACKDHRGDT